ncbi:30S ribosomal protein S21 [Candidatus Kaiserbacteria bacterium]|nr:30S ribosomal protein S21 [Candidatus Kaiserbacteria bacterium]
MINAEVVKTGTENALSTIRRFTRRAQGANIIKTVRNKRYYSRSSSQTVKKKRALKLLKRREEFKQLVKEGKVAETPTRRPGFNRPQSTTENTSSSSKFGEGTPIAR